MRSAGFMRSSACVRAQSLQSCQLFATPWTVASQTPLSMGFSRQEYWSGLPCPPPGDLPDPEIEPVTLMSPALAGGFFTTLPLGSPDTTPRDADLRGEAGPMHLRFQGTPGDVHSFSQHIFTMCWMFF